MSPEVLFFYATIFVFGLIIGSFLNCVIYRLEKEETLQGRSYCPHCKHTLHWHDLIPVVSFLLLGGKCKYCHKKISIQYPLVELATGLIFLLIFNQLEISQCINALFLFYIFSSLIVIFVYDVKFYIIPDKVLFPAIVITFAYRFFESFNHLNLISNFKFQISNFAPLGNYLLAAVIASCFFLAIYLISRGQWMGFGDVKLAVLLGLLLGFPNILVGLFLAFFFGAIIGIISMTLGKKGLKSQLPFAPFLILGTLVALCWGQQIISWYTYFLLF